MAGGRPVNAVLLTVELPVTGAAFGDAERESYIAAVAGKFQHEQKQQSCIQASCFGELLVIIHGIFIENHFGSHGVYV